MQQYFMEQPLRTGELVRFSPEQAHHAGTVVRLDNERIRLVHDGRAFFAVGQKKGKEFYALVEEEDPRNNELDTEVTLAMALIRREKMEFVLQKATELGVARIVPFESSRCVVHAKKEKKDRWESIVTEAARQCKRNRIPVLEEAVPFDRLKEFRCGTDLACYEKASAESLRVASCLKGKACTVVIGPEGGFSEAEMEELAVWGFIPVTLGSRILRAETAALYALSVIGEWEGIR